jgi:hypothetical protein
MAYGVTYLVFLTPEAFDVAPGNLVHSIYQSVSDLVLSSCMYDLPVSPRFAAVS